MENQKRAKLWVDFETGGVELHHSPLSFAMIATIDDRIYGEWYTQIRQHPLYVETKALEINKIDLNESGLNFEEFKKEYNIRINKWFYGGTNFTSKGAFPKERPNKENMPFFCGWNVAFDRPILKKVLGSNFDGAYYHSIDPMILSNTLVDIGILPRIENLRLETVAQFFDIPPQGEFHNALTDVKMTFEIYKKLKNLISKSVIHTLTKDAVNESVSQSCT